MTPVCLICAKSLQYVSFQPGDLIGSGCDQIEDGGNVEISFHYGSSFDIFMGNPFAGRTPIKAYICDECFDKVKDRTTFAEIAATPDPDSLVVIPPEAFIPKDKQ